MRSRSHDCVVMLPTGNRTGSVRMLSLATGKIVTRDQFKILPMPVSVILLLNRMAAADGITAESITGVLNHAIRDYDPIVSHLPAYFTPTLHDHPPGEIELADEIGLGAPADGTDEIGYAEAGGVPRLRNDDSGHLNDPIHDNPDAVDGGGDIWGDIGGDIGGAPSESGGEQHVGGDFRGDAHAGEDDPRSGGDVGEHTEGQIAEHESGLTHQNDAQGAPARTPDG
jgi:hypothetical protein